MDPDRSHSWFVRAAAVLGDLSNPFYREERQRDVWNEASAVALQVVLVLSLLAETAAVWIIGAPAVPYAWALMVIIAIASGVAIVYARSLGVNADDPQRMWRPRMIPYLAVLGLLFVGLLLASKDLLREVEDSPSFIRGFVQGAVFGGPVGLMAAVAGLLLGFRRSRARQGEVSDRLSGPVGQHRGGTVRTAGDQQRRRRTGEPVRTVDPDRSHSWFVRAAAFLGDLSNPFYREERQRDVWNEASAVALQVILVLSLLAETAAVWIIGADALPYVYTLLGIVAIAGWIAILYAWSLGVHAEDPQRMWRPRMIPYLAVLALLVAGLLRATPQDTSSDTWSTIAGMVTGGLALLVVAVAGWLYARKRSRAREQD